MQTEGNNMHEDFKDKKQKATHPEENKNGE